jgi:molybdate transport system ATP-binding protein
LSGGEARRVALARAILVAGSAGTLVLDEPLEALDRLRRVRTLGLLLALKARTDVRVVVVSLRADELALLCDAVQHLTASGDRRSMAPPAKPEVALATEGIHENRLLGEVVDVAGDAATLRVGTAAIIVPSQDLVVGARAVFGLRGDDVLLGLADPGRVSARNKLAGTVRTLRPSGTYVELDVDLGAFDLSTHLTHSAVADLELKAGAPVHLFFKTRAVRLLALLPPGVPDGSV